MQTDHADGRVQVLLEEGVGLLILNDPEHRNALSAAMCRGVVAALEELEAEAGLRVLVLSGAGSKSFVAGETLDADADAAARREYDGLAAAAAARLAGFPLPVIARIRGSCLGVGMGLALAADLRLAGAGAEFGLPGVGVGLAPDRALVRRLVALVGPGEARALLFGGATIDAAEAVRIRLVGQVVSDEALSDAVLELARTLADLPPLALRAAKAIMGGLDDPDGEAAAEKQATACRDSRDHAEARAAMKEHRAAKFEGS